MLRRRQLVFASADQQKPSVIAKHLSHDNLPYLGPIPGLRGAYAATGHFRNGILLAPITGVLLTEMILQQPPTLPLEPYHAARLWQNAS